MYFKRSLSSMQTHSSEIPLYSFWSTKRVKVKEMEFSYGAEKVFNFDIPRLQHGNDGLIYTSAQSAYTVGTDPKMQALLFQIKYHLFIFSDSSGKPHLKIALTSSLCCDFLQIPKSQDSLIFARNHYLAYKYIWVTLEGSLDMNPMMKCMLMKRNGKGDYFSNYVPSVLISAICSSMKLSGEQVDDRIVEVHWEPSTMRWRMMRFRDDKPNGNHHSVVKNIIQSIMDGVEKEDVIISCKLAWRQCSLIFV